MMDDVRAYLLSVVAAAIISGVVINLVGNHGAYSGVIKLLTGIFLSITVISPLTKFTINDMTSYFSGLQTDASQIVYNGTTTAQTAAAEIIKENTEAYILEKAAFIGAALEVTVYLTDDSPPAPKSVEISGAVAPYAKMKLQDIIENDLAIPKENQSWT